MSFVFYIGPFLYGAIGGAVCCLAFFFYVFRKIEQLTANVIRKKALKHAEFDAVAKAAAEVPNTKVETLCKLVRFDDDIVGEAIQCRAVFYGSTIFFYAVDELLTLPDHRQEVQREHLLGKINVSCVDVEAKRISKYHRHINATQRHAPVKGKCTILTAREDTSLFVVDPTLMLKERLEAAKEERKLMLKLLRRQVQAAARGDDAAMTRGPINIETMHALIEQDRARRQARRAHKARMAATAPALSADFGSLGKLEGAAEAYSPHSLDETLTETASPPQPPLQGSTSVSSEGSPGGWAASASRWAEAARRSVGPWLGSRVLSPTAREGEAASPLSSPFSAAGDAADGSTGVIGTLRTHLLEPLMTALLGMGAGSRGGAGVVASSLGRGRPPKASRAAGSATRSHPSARAGEDEDEGNAAVKLAAMEKTLYNWRVVAIKFPTRRENERWLNLLQSTEQTAQWRDFIAHLPKHDVLNLLLARLFFESTRTSGLHDLLIKKLGKNLAKTSKSLPQNVKGNIYLDDLVVGGEVPLISNVSDPVHHANGELDIDFDVLYRGGLCMSIRFAITFRDIRVPDIVFHIKVLELAGRVRFNVGPPPTEKFWLGGPRPPSLRLEFTQEVASHEGFLNAVVSILPDMSKVMTNIVKVLLFEDMVLPSLDDFPWPVFDAKPAPEVSGADAKSDSDNDPDRTESASKSEGKSESKAEAKARKKAEKALEKKARKDAESEKKRNKEEAKRQRQQPPKHSGERDAAEEEDNNSTGTHDVADTTSQASASSPLQRLRLWPRRTAEAREDPGGDAEASPHGSDTPKKRTATLLPTPLTPRQPLDGTAAGQPNGDDETATTASSSRLPRRRTVTAVGAAEQSPEPVNPWAPATNGMAAVPANGQPTTIIVRAAGMTGEQGTGSDRDEGQSSARPRPALEGSRDQYTTGGDTTTTRHNLHQSAGNTANTATVPTVSTSANAFTTTSTATNRAATNRVNHLNGADGKDSGGTTTTTTIITAERLTEDILRRVRGSTGRRSGRLPERVSLDTLTVTTTATERVRRVQKEEAEISQTFQDTPVEFFSAGAGKVRRGDDGAYVSSGAAAVVSATSASRRPSRQITPYASHARGERVPAPASASSSSPSPTPALAARPTAAAADNNRDAGGEGGSGIGVELGNGNGGEAPSASPTELATATERTSVVSGSFASTARSSRLPPRKV